MDSFKEELLNRYHVSWYVEDTDYDIPEDEEGFTHSAFFTGRYVNDEPRPAVLIITYPEDIENLRNAISFLQGFETAEDLVGYMKRVADQLEEFERINKIKN